MADALVGMAGGVMGGLGGFTGVLPTLWCTLRGLDKDVQRAIIQNFNLAMLLVTFVTYLATGLVTARRCRCWPSWCPPCWCPCCWERGCTTVSATRGSGRSCWGCSRCQGGDAGGQPAQGAGFVGLRRMPCQSAVRARCGEALCAKGSAGAGRRAAHTRALVGAGSGERSVWLERSRLVFTK